MPRPLRDRVLDVTVTGRVAAARLTGFAWRAPDFVILGAQKAGTTALYQFLSEHPDVAPAVTKEVHYFDLAPERGPHWYRAHFAPAALAQRRGRTVLTGESTPYYLYHPRAPDRVAADGLDARFVILLRDPIDRAVSHYHHERALGWESLSLTEAVDAEPRRLLAPGEDFQDPAVTHAHQHFAYVERGRYAPQLRRWFARFPRERFLVLDHDRMRRDPDATWRQVCTFLDLDPAARPRDGFGSVYGRRYDPPAGEVCRTLEEKFAEDRRELAEMNVIDAAWL